MENEQTKKTETKNDKVEASETKAITPKKEPNWQDKLIDAIGLENQSLREVVKLLSNPVTLIILLIALNYWYRQRNQATAANAPPQTNDTAEELKKLKKKNKQLKRKMQQQLPSNEKHITSFE